MGSIGTRQRIESFVDARANLAPLKCACFLFTGQSHHGAVNQNKLCRIPRFVESYQPVDDRYEWTQNGKKIGNSYTLDLRECSRVGRRNWRKPRRTDYQFIYSDKSNVNFDDENGAGL